MELLLLVVREHPRSSQPARGLRNHDIRVTTETKITKKRTITRHLSKQCTERSCPRRPPRASALARRHEGSGSGDCCDTKARFDPVHVAEIAFHSSWRRMPRPDLASRHAGAKRISAALPSPGRMNARARQGGRQRWLRSLLQCHPPLSKISQADPSSTRKGGRVGALPVSWTCCVLGNGWLWELVGKWYEPLKSKGSRSQPGKVFNVRTQKV
jgi:hypothetical protein